MRKILFIFILMVSLVPFQAFGETNESAGGYKFSCFDEKYHYAFGDGYYISVPDEIVIDSKDFNALDVIETDISSEMLSVVYEFDLEEDNNKDVIFMIRYKDAVVSANAYIEIKDYIKINEDIIVNNYDFDLWNHIDTNIENKKDIEIIGEYDLNINGKYGVLLKYQELIKSTVIIVDIENNKEVEIVETTCPVEETKKEVLTYETKNYTSNYYDYHYYTNESNSDIKEVTCTNIPTPINRIIYSDTDSNNDLFYYISYTFYGLVIILLSIIVVRKK